MNLIKEIINILWIIWSILLLISIISLLIFIFKFILNKFKLYWILSKNLSRKIAIVLPSNANEFKMDVEINKLNNGIFKLEKPYNWYNDFIPNNDIWLIIVWYKKWCVWEIEFDNLIKKILTHKLPIIFYTYWDSQAFNFIVKDENDSNKLKDKCAESLKQYNNYLVDNFSLKLIWDVYNVLSIYK